MPYIGSFSLITIAYGVIDTLLNLWMIQQSVSDKIAHRVIHYGIFILNRDNSIVITNIILGDTAWEKLMKKIGVRYRLYGYF